MTSVAITNLVRRFGNTTVVDAIDLQIREGEFCTILGPSGCGKTTTLRMIAGLDHSDAGRITLGERVVDEPASGIFVPPERRAIGMVFQSYAIWPHMTVFENVAFPLVVRHRSRKEVRSRVLESLRLVNLDEVVDRPATSLSGGQQQRVAIARAIVFEPSLLLMDEPLSNLDARLRDVMRLELRALQRRLAITTIYVTHDQDEAMSLSDRIVVMEKGKVLQQAAPEDLYNNPISGPVANFLGVPNIFAAIVVDAHIDVKNDFYVDVQWKGRQTRARGATTLRVGDPANLVIRSETINLSGCSGGHDLDSLRGTIIQDSFRGPRRTYVVDSDVGSLYVDAGGNSAFRVGDTLSITLDASKLWVVPI